ncbi:hypothetical protein TNCV_3193301 [Trichonephila clavipes]|nr:hypothetical protein TNCV_3193301 [Trichonephila clavipes]
MNKCRDSGAPNNKLYTEVAPRGLFNPAPGDGRDSHRKLTSPVIETSNDTFLRSLGPVTVSYLQGIEDVLFHQNNRRSPVSHRVLIYLDTDGIRLFL